MINNLYDYQKKAIKNMHNGCILCGGVGSGKSRTAIGYYYIKYDKSHKDLYIITTAKKRDTGEWLEDLKVFDKDSTHNTIVDSWNNIKKYKDVKNAFFIFDEQRLVGNGAWVKSFYKIAKANNWILLTATPGDNWMDYIPVFVANGFYKNRTAFLREHVIYSSYTNFPKIDRYINTGRLIRLRNNLLVNMEFERKTNHHIIPIVAQYDRQIYKTIGVKRWDPYKDEPITNAAGLCYVWRKVVNSDINRRNEYLKIVKKKERVIVFYNFDYELHILKEMPYPEDYEIAEWNGHKHQPIPEGNKWVYLVQYNAAAEGWNCIRTDTIIFYSQNYSYKTMVQAAGRIDRLNTPYKDLYYYHIQSHAPIDLAIKKALKQKKKFNETKYIREVI